MRRAILRHNALAPAFVSQNNKVEPNLHRATHSKKDKMSDSNYSSIERDAEEDLLKGNLIIGLIKVTLTLYSFKIIVTLVKLHRL